MAIPLSDNIYTESNKPADARYGPYASTSLAKSSVPVPYRHIGLTVGILEEGKVVDYWWESGTDDTDLVIKSSDGTGTSETPESIKTKYESNENTNAFTDAEKTKLSGIDAGATKNESTDDLEEGTTNKYFTEARAVGSKLAGYVKAETVEALSSAKTVLEAISILEKALDTKVNLTPGGMLVVQAEKDRWNNTYTKAETDNLVSGAIASLIWKDDVAEFADLATEYPDAIEGWTSVVNSENKIYRFDGTSWIPIGDITIPMATETVDGKMSKEDFVKLRDIEAEATKNDNTDELDEGTTNKYFTEARAVAAKIAGYVKAGSSAPLAEADSILQALGKLERLLDDRLSIRGDNYLCLIPGPNPEENGSNFISAYNLLSTFTPGGNPLGSDNRVTLILFTGYYDISGSLGSSGAFYLQNFVDIAGFGPKESIIINSGYEQFIQPSTAPDVRLSNFRNNGSFITLNYQSTDTGKSVYRDLMTGFNTIPYEDYTIKGTFENISKGGGTFPLFYSLGNFEGTLKNIEQWPLDIPFHFKSINGAVIDNVKALTLTNQLKNSEVWDSRIAGYHGTTGSGPNELHIENTKIVDCEISGNEYTEIDGIYIEDDSVKIHRSVLGKELSLGSGLSNVNIEIYHSHFTGEGSPLPEGMTNTITNGHNTWDEEGGGDGYETPEEVRDALSELTGEDRLDASAIKNLPSTGLTPEQEAKLENVPANTISELGNKVDKEEGKGLSSNDYTLIEKNKLGNIEEEAQKNVQSDWNQEDSNSDDFIKNKPTLFSGSFDDLEDVPTSFPSTIEDVDGLEAELIDLQDQITTNENERIFVVNFRDKLEYIFEWTESIKINSIKVKPESGQTIDLGGYTLGTTLAAWTPLEITSNQFGVVELIGEISQEEEFNTHSLVIPSFGTGIEISDNSIYPWSTDSQNDKPISFEICFKPTLMANLGYIVRFEDNSGLKLAIMHEYDGRARIDFQMSNGNRLSGKTGAGEILINDWNHFIFTYNGSKLLSGIKIYKKNKPYLSLSGSSSQGTYNGLQNLSGNLKIKVPVTPGTEANKFIGKINFFRIFEKELTQIESDWLLDNWGPVSIDESDIKQYCVLEHRFNNNLLSNIGKDAIAVGNLTYDNDVPAVVSYPDNTLNFTTTELDSLYWPGIYKSSDWPMLDISKPYFTIYSSDHAPSGGGIAWGECDDLMGNGFVEKGVIISGNQAETPILLHVPLSVSGLSEDEVFLYYHTSAGEPGNDGKQQTRLITCSGGVLHNTQWTDRGRPLGLYNDDAHTGYATPRFNSNGKIVASHLTVGGSNPKFYTSISDDGLVFTRSIETTALTIDNYQYLKNEVRDFKWNNILYGFVCLRVGGLTKIAVATLDDNFIPLSIVYMLDKFYDIRQMMINVEGSIAYIRFKGGDNTNRFEPYYQITFNLELLNE